MKFINYLICLQILTISLSAENIPEYLLDENYQPQFETKFEAGNANCNHLHKHFKGDELLAGRPESSQIEYRPYDVLKYDLYLNWYDLMAKNGKDKDVFKEYTGIVKIDIKIDSVNTEYIELDAGDFTIISVSFDGYVYDEVPQPDSTNILIIPAPESGWEINTIGTLEIVYTYYGNGRKGVYIFPEGFTTRIPQTHDSIINPHNIAYTQSEPNDARYWFPCNDAPHDKAEYEISISVPKGYSAPSNGRLESIEESGDTLTFNWVGKYPISTYLMVAYASKYKLSTDYFNRSETDSIPIMNYIWAEDDNDASGIFKGFDAFKNTAHMLELYSDRFVEYPYDKYGHAAVYPYDYGGMEHTTMTTVHRNWLRGNSESGIAHEVAHHWIGDMITCATWKDLWINEGGASWCEALWAEEIDKETWRYTQHMYWQSVWYFQSAKNPNFGNDPIYDVNEKDLFAGATFLIYAKASWVYHMLYEWSGKEAFLGAMKRLFTDYYFQAVETAAFERIMKEELTGFPVPIETFFDQFVYGGGHPIFTIDTHVGVEIEGKYNVMVDISQIQDNEQVADSFAVPVGIIFIENLGGNDKMYHYKTPFVMDGRKTVQNFELDFKPDSVTIDRSKLLCEIKQSITTDVKETVLITDDISIYPNPATSGEEINVMYSAANSGIANLDVYDSQGNKLFELQNNSVIPGKNMLKIPTSNLSSGIYFGRIYTGSSVTNFKFSIVK